MEQLFITKIILEKVRNIAYTEIPLSQEQRKHLIITGKNGSGKTTILDCLAKSLDGRTGEKSTADLKESLLFWMKQLQEVTDTENLQEIDDIKKRIAHYTKRLGEVKRGIDLQFNKDEYTLPLLFEKGDFIIAYYKADRVFYADIPKHVEKIELQTTYTSEEVPRQNFIKYLLDLKTTQAFALTNGKKEKANLIEGWFKNFENLLQEIFENKNLRLEFDEETYGFYIQEPGKEKYDFNSLSSGYAAILDIVVDIMIRMEKQTDRKFMYDLQGIVLIDEIETHLHLELQKKILKLLTTTFPNIQFIISTHSPFILNSISNVVIYDLEQKIIVNYGLENVPYDGIVEGYFKADTLSDELKQKFERYKVLVNKPELTDNDIEEITDLEMFLDEIPDYLALNITTEYQRLKLILANREDING